MAEVLRNLKMQMNLKEEQDLLKRKKKLSFKRFVNMKTNMMNIG